CWPTSFLSSPTSQLEHWLPSYASSPTPSSSNLSVLLLAPHTPEPPDACCPPPKPLEPNALVPLVPTPCSPAPQHLHLFTWHQSPKSCSMPSAHHLLPGD
ncbi:unnamed protein product, partial [Ilex paraguariensis]